jgi:hypothetical protein
VSLPTDNAIRVLGVLWRPMDAATVGKLTGLGELAADYLRDLTEDDRVRCVGGLWERA